MTIISETHIYEGVNRAKLSISRTIEKFARVAYWRVCYSINGKDFYILKDGLKNKPTRKQIERYLATL